ncbi:MAG: hypothetical protein WCQ67_03330 [Treponema sp.]
MKKNRICWNKKNFSQFISSSKKILILICVFFISSSILFAEDKTVISIDSAQKTEYKKDKDSGDDTIVLTGNVSISITSGSTKTTITADTVNYNRKTNMLYATGSVALKQTGGSEGGEDIKADSLLFNTSTLEGVFDNGHVIQTQSSAINLPSGSTLRVSSSMFGRDSSNTIAFKNGVLTFCEDENPHWKIRASRIWLLPGGEFAFVNAVLFVGHVPLMYFPAFYYPKDELVFNPVFGYNSRTGYYVQTTTYLYGRKPLSSTTSSSSSSSTTEDISAGLFNFMKPSALKEQKREGLVLHNLDENYTGDTTNYLKVMGDYYSNLGFLVGIDGVMKPSDYITNIQANLNLGFSNTVFKDSNGNYLPYSSTGVIYSDSSNFMGLELPFRYSANLKMTMSKPFSLTLSLPIYSDAYFNYDYGTRSESMDWIGFLMSGAEDDDEDSASSISSFTWALNGSYTQKLPDFLSPFISSLSISSFSSQIIFSSKSRTFSEDEKTNDNWSTYTPERTFFYPSQITPFKITGKLAGNIIQIPIKTSTSKKTENKFPIKLEPPEELKEPDSEKKDNESESSNSTEEDSLIIAEKDLPDLNTSTALNVISFSNLTYSLDYSITPTFTSQVTYDSSKLTSPEDFDWTSFKSTYYQVKVPVVLTSSLGYRSSFLTMKNNFTFNPILQDHPYLDSSYSETSAASLKITDYDARKLDLTNTNSISFKPFLYNSIFKDTGLSWNTTVKMIRTNFIGDAENPEWEYLTTDVTDEDCVTVHTLSGNISATEDKFSQVFTLSTTLPPQVDEYTGSLKLTFPYLSLDFSSGIKQTSSTDNSWTKNPFKQSASLSLFDNKLKFTESFNYELEDNNPDSMKVALSWNNFQLAYTMAYTYGYDFSESDNSETGMEAGWNVRDTEEFLPYSASIAYSTSSKTYRYWKNRITWAPALNTSVVYDCLRPTNSYFKFIPSISFKINNFLNLSFSSESKNSVIFRYFQKYVGYEGTVGGETNPFIDLLNSFVFWSDDSFWDPDQTKRKASGYKLKNLKVTITHDLCDWDLSASCTIKPYLIDQEYRFNPYFTLSVVWNPLSSMKTEFVYNDDYNEKWELNP